MLNVTSQPLAPTAALTTRDNPWPLALLSHKIKAYVDRMSALWVTGQVVEYRRRPGTKMAFFVLRDHDSDVSMTVKCFGSVIAPLGDAFDEGASVTVWCKPDFYPGNGSLALFAKEIHIEGIGSLLQRIEELRRKLQAEGVFDASHKRPLPFMPRTVGLICGRNAKARHDVEVNGAARWPAIRFEIREVAVQGPQCVGQVCAALAELDAIPEVDVIIIARGGGSVEDLLPFSDEQMIRAVAACSTPVVSAIGHETDTPLLDFVADYRASTPTAAARAVIPDLADEQAHLNDARTKLRALVTGRLDRERQGLSDMRARPVMTSPASLLTPHRDGLAAARARLEASMTSRVSLERSRLEGTRASLRALSPQSVLERGYTIARTPGKTVIRSVHDVKKGDLIELLFADGSGVTHMVGTQPRPAAGEDTH